MGYAGGAEDNPTYHALENHTESIQIDYDPSRISYEELLDVYWSSNTCRPTWSTQYMSILFVHDDGQERAAKRSRAEQIEERGRDVHTEIRRAPRFWRAEDYHQKYLLRNRAGLMQRFREIYPKEIDFVDSTSAARMNGYLAGYGDKGRLAEELGPLADGLGG